MDTKAPLLDEVTALAVDLEAAGYSPVLVGGMALILLGSERATFDFDFVVAADKPRSDDLMALVYARGLELITKYTPQKAVQRTVDSLTVAQLKVRMELPVTIPFFNWSSRLRVDLMQDFPVPAIQLMKQATTVRLEHGAISIASPEDLRRLKELAFRDRKAGKDAQDLEFLKAISPK